MQHTLAVGVSNRVANAHQYLEQPSESDIFRPIGGRSLLVELPDGLAQSPAVNKLHDVIGLAGVIEAHVMQGHDTGMLELTCDLCLDEEPRLFGIAAGPKFFQGDAASNALVFRQPNFTHSAFSMKAHRPITS